MARKRPTRKVRVDFRQNRQVRRRSDEWTQKYRADEKQLDDTQRSESVRAKGDLSRKRTIIAGPNERDVAGQAHWRPATVTRVHGLLCTVHDDDGQAWECTVRRILRTRQIEGRSPVVVGDHVWFAGESDHPDGAYVGVIERVEPRKSWLSRRDRRKREHAIVANADRLLAIVSVAQPRLRPHLADRYLVAAQHGGLEPVLCFNKMDLLTPDAVTEEDDERQSGLAAAEVIQEFRDLGYRCLCTSAVTGAGLDELRDALKDHLTVLSGQSGVGKSTLLNAIQPGLNLTTQTVSDETEKGRHTTTLAELYRLDFGGFVVDTPGIRAFDLWSIEPGQLEAYFAEFLPRIQSCRFADCSHRHEEGCAIIAAVEAGEISVRRYYSYLKMFEEV